MDRDALAELFAPVLTVSIRPMFGGHGLYGPAGIFAIAVDGALFFKVDDETRPVWQAAGSTPFTYVKARGEQAVMSYFSLPESAYDDPVELRDWVALAEAAARRATGSTARKPAPKRAKPA